MVVDPITGHTENSTFVDVLPGRYRAVAHLVDTVWLDNPRHRMHDVAAIAIEHVDYPTSGKFDLTASVAGVCSDCPLRLCLRSSGAVACGPGP